MQTPRPESTPTFGVSDSLDLDTFHGRIVDEVTATDALRAADGELIWLRKAEPHEFCQPLTPCLAWPTWVIVRAFGPGVRLREALPADWIRP